MEERVQKIIAQAGICSRRKAEDLIIAGKVSVNNKPITIGDKANPQEDFITISGKPIQVETKVYYMLNKPKNYITTSDDLYNRKIITDLLPQTPRVYAVGRLDRDTTGLLILTNDGDFKNKITHPRYNVNKTYKVSLDKPFNKEDAKTLEEGIYIDKKKVKSKIKIINKTTLEVTVHVGLHKVVKRLLKNLGYYVKNLERIKIGKLKLDVPIGAFRNLTEEDKNLIFSK